MASSLIAKRFLSSSLLSRSLLRLAAFASHCSFNTNTMRQYDNHTDDHSIDIGCRSERSFPSTARRDDIFSANLALNGSLQLFLFMVLVILCVDPFFSTRSLSQVLNMMNQVINNLFLFVSHEIEASAGVHCTGSKLALECVADGTRGRQRMLCFIPRNP
ncbi:Heat shock 22 kDa protein, mitochondrial [Glycine soja]|uniref:Heat shock 22 kDa protein, mitochondrial n=1 Tax=Glycine soja TaxID=3848 RepID=A0A445LBK8_GLYSO|nr:Heat shock 22 kDa protein, mitochondrial [Glycine soja]